jgi:5'-3' exonuclease
MNTLRRFIDEYNYDKVIVFWDGENNSIQRKRIFAEYKENRRYNRLNDIQKQSYDWQMGRVKQYLEEMFIRPVDENKTIFSADKDLTQLISESVQVYSPSQKEMIKFGDKVKLKDISIPHQNVSTFKIISGDKSDNIDGIYYFGEKTFSKLFPEIIDSVVSVDDILQKGEKLHENDKDNKALQNLLSGKTKRGVYGEEFYVINKQLVDLSQPLLTEEARELVQLYYEEDIDPEGRGYQNLMRMMMDDGLFKYLPKTDNAWVYFLTPFMKLTRKEKRRFKKTKK